jgi:hypothetical protein
LVSSEGIRIPAARRSNVSATLTSGSLGGTVTIDETMPTLSTADITAPGTGFGPYIGPPTFTPGRHAMERAAIRPELVERPIIYGICWSSTTGSVLWIRCAEAWPRGVVAARAGKASGVQQPSSDAEESWPVVCAELLSLQNYISGEDLVLLCFNIRCVS